MTVFRHGLPRAQYLLNDNTQSQFFRLIVSGYIENDELIYKYLEQCKEKFQIQGKNKRDKIDRIKKEKH